MDRYEQLRQKLRNCETVTMANLMILQSPLLLRAFESADCVLVDKEHGIYNSETMIPLTMQCRTMGLPTVVRVEDAEYHLIAKAIDMGADGIMLPRTESVEQIRTAVEAMRFAPTGRTGCGGWALFQPGGESYEAFQRSRVLLPQIESQKGRLAMEAMLDAYGDEIDGFIIGPADYSILMGVPLQIDHPIMLEEYEKVYEVCRKYRKSCGMWQPDLEHIARDKRMGANIFWVSNDLSYLKAGFEALQDAARAE